MKILALDTATEACSAALLIDGEITERYEVAPRRHNELILPMIDEVLSASGVQLKQLDYLAFGRGPGAFTGVRIAAGVVQGLALSQDIPVVGISDLAALALQLGTMHGWDKVIVLSDARMGEVYQGRYEVAADRHTADLVGEESVGPPGAVQAPGEAGWFAGGGGFAAYRDQLGAVIEKLAGEDADCLPRAREVALLAVHVAEKGGATAAEDALPVYLRDKVTD